MNLETFCSCVFAFCKAFGGNVTSWIRTPSHNKAVGGVANSKHLDGLAVDVILDSPENRDPFIAACRSVKLRAFWDKDHVHVEAI